MIKDFYSTHNGSDTVTIPKVLDHYRNEASKIKDEENDWRYIQFRTLTTIAIEQHKKNEFESLAVTMMNLGSIVKRITMSRENTVLDNDTYSELAQAASKHWKSIEKTKERNWQVSELKRYAQKIALALWFKDQEQRIRVGEMVQKVYTEHLVDFCDRSDRGVMDGWMDLLPDKNSRTLREWFSEVAPEYAKKAGAPKK